MQDGNDRNYQEALVKPALEKMKRVCLRFSEEDCCLMFCSYLAQQELANWQLTVHGEGRRNGLATGDDPCSRPDTHPSARSLVQGRQLGLDTPMVL